MTNPAITAQQPNALPGRPGGPYAANLPPFIPKRFILVASRAPRWSLVADRQALYILVADRLNRYPLEV